MAKRKRIVSQTGRDTKAGFSTETETPDIPDYVVVELRYESPVAYSRSKFSAPAAAAPQADTLNNVLEKYDIKTLRSHFGLSSPAIKDRVEIAATLPPEIRPATWLSEDWAEVRCSASALRYDAACSSLTPARRFRLAAISLRAAGSSTRCRTSRGPTHRS